MMKHQKNRQGREEIKFGFGLSKRLVTEFKLIEKQWIAQKEKEEEQISNGKQVSI